MSFVKPTNFGEREQEFYVPAKRAPKRDDAIEREKHISNGGEYARGDGPRQRRQDRPADFDYPSQAQSARERDQPMQPSRDYNQYQAVQNVRNHQSQQPQYQNRQQNGYANQNRSQQQRYEQPQQHNKQYALQQSEQRSHQNYSQGQPRYDNRQPQPPRNDLRYQEQRQEPQQRNTPRQPQSPQNDSRFFDSYAQHREGRSSGQNQRMQERYGAPQPSPHFEEQPYVSSQRRSGGRDQLVDAPPRDNHPNQNAGNRPSDQAFQRDRSGQRGYEERGSQQRYVEPAQYVQQPLSQTRFENQREAYQPRSARPVRPHRAEQEQEYEPVQKITVVKIMKKGRDVDDSTLTDSNDVQDEAEPAVKKFSKAKKLAIKIALERSNKHTESYSIEHDAAKDLTDSLGAMSITKKQNAQSDINSHFINDTIVKEKFVIVKTPRTAQLDPSEPSQTVTLGIARTRSAPPQTPRSNQTPRGNNSPYQNSPSRKFEAPIPSAKPASLCTSTPAKAAIDKLIAEKREYTKILKFMAVDGEITEGAVRAMLKDYTGFAVETTEFDEILAVFEDAKDAKRVYLDMIGSKLAMVKPFDRIVKDASTLDCLTPRQKKKTDVARRMVVCALQTNGTDAEVVNEAVDGNSDV